MAPIGMLLSVGGVGAGGMTFAQFHAPVGAAPKQGVRKQCLKTHKRREGKRHHERVSAARASRHSAGANDPHANEPDRDGPVAGASPAHPRQSNVKLPAHSLSHSLFESRLTHLMRHPRHPRTSTRMREMPTGRESFVPKADLAKDGPGRAVMRCGEEKVLRGAAFLRENGARTTHVASTKHSYAVSKGATTMRSAAEKHTYALSELIFKDQIGNGGTGNVYRADFQTKAFAVRRVGTGLLLTDTSIVAFHQEIDNLKRLSHPHLLHVLGLASGNQLVSTMVVLELAQMSLHEAFKSGQLVAGSWHPSHLQLLREVGWALTYLHERHLIHGRLHPRNVMLTSEMQVKLADFARAHFTPLAANGEHDAGCVRWAYMAPERFSADGGAAAPAVNGRLSSCAPPSDGEGALTPAPVGARASITMPWKGALRLGIRNANEPTATKMAKADVWSFGCLTAFVATGEAPCTIEMEMQVKSGYSTPGDVIEAARRHGISPLLHLQSVRESCPAALYSLACDCVQIEPLARPTSSQLVAILNEACREHLAGLSPAGFPMSWSCRKGQNNSNPGAASQPVPSPPQQRVDRPPPSSDGAPSGSERGGSGRGCDRVGSRPASRCGTSIGLPVAPRLPAPQNAVDPRVRLEKQPSFKRSTTRSHVPESAARQSVGGQQLVEEPVPSNAVEEQVASKAAPLPRYHI